MATIQGVYLALFGRPADPLGLAFFNSATNNGANLNAIGNLASTAEYQGRFTGQSNVQIINSIYQSLFGRDAEATGLTFFANALSSGRLTINNIAIAILDGAQGSDLTTVNNKIAAANLFTAAIDTGSEIVAYSGTAAADAGRTFISGVTTTVPTQAAVDAAIANIVSNPAATSTVTLTTGVDTVAGTSGNDTINAYVAATAAGTGSTLTAADSINGGSGTDTLNLTMDGDQNAGLPAATITSVENFFIRNVASAGTQTYNFASVTGEKQVWNNVSSRAVTFDNLEAGATVGVKGDNVSTVATTTFSMATATDAVSIAIDGGVKGGNAITNTSNGATGATIASSGTANTVGAIQLSAGATVTATTINAAADLTTGNITGHKADAKMTITGAGKVSIGTLEAAVDVVDASANTGGVTVTLDGEADTVFTGGKGNDVVTTGFVLTTGSVAAGEGTADRLVVAGSTHINTAALGAKYTGFEVLQVQDGVSQDVSLVSGITSVRISDGGAATGVTNLSAAQAKAITLVGGGAGAVTIGVKGASDVGQIDTVVIAADDGATAVSTIALTAPVLTGVENLELNAATDGINVTALTSAAALTSIKLSGANASTITSGAITVNANTVVDASGMTKAATIDFGGVTAGTNAVRIIGGSGDDVITATGVTADLIEGGKGLDTIVITKDGAATNSIVRSEAILSADADKITGFVTTENKFDFNGVLSNGSATSADGIAGGEVVTEATVAAALANANAQNAAVYVVTGNIADGGSSTQSTALGTLVTTFNKTNADAFVSELLKAGGALNGTIANLDTVLGTSDAALLALDNGTHSVILRITNTDTATANTLTAAEVQVVGVLDSTAALAAGDFV